MITPALKITSDLSYAISIIVEDFNNGVFGQATMACKLGDLIKTEYRDKTPEQFVLFDDVVAKMV